MNMVQCRRQDMRSDEIEMTPVVDSEGPRCSEAPSEKAGDIFEEPGETATASGDYIQRKNRSSECKYASLEAEFGRVLH